MPNLIEDYKNLLTELIQKEMVIVGPDIALEIGQSTPGLTVDSSGTVIDIKGDVVMVFHDVVDAYLNLSKTVTQIVFYSLLDKYTNVRAQYREPLEKIKLVCSIVGHNHS